MPGNPERLAGQVCVITGAAGAIGASVAARLEREGATVAGVDRREHAVGALSLQADLTDEEQVRRLFARIHDAFGRIDVLYNNAGLNDPSDHSALDLPLETWERVLAANLTTAGRHGRLPGQRRRRLRHRLCFPARRGHPGCVHGAVLTAARRPPGRDYAVQVDYPSGSTAGRCPPGMRGR